MKQSLFFVLILRAVFTFADGELEANSINTLEENSLTALLPTGPSQLNCSSVQLDAICDCDYASLGLSCRNVTNTDSVLLALEHLFNLTQTHYWNALSVHFVNEISTAYQITNQWFTGKVRFASVALVGNCSRYNEEIYSGGQFEDTEVRKMVIQENTHFLNWDGGYMAYGILFRPIVGLKSLSELTISASRFKDNTIRRQFSEMCSKSCPEEAHPLLKLTINYCNVSLIESGAFRNLVNLELIELSYNQLSQLPRSAFPKTLTNLRILKLEHNRLTSLEAGFFDGLPQLRKVNLSFNRLTMLPSFTPSSTFFQVFHLRQNPWQCRCPMTWILGAPGFPDNLADKPVCASPDYVQNKPLIAGLTVVNSTFC